uniref:Uncharacterized protein n=1 Tax=Mycolicibacterium mucogenicum DSM 44124 TaxID=1226753 RepID=A0A8H2PFC4_MYCMU
MLLASFAPGNDRAAALCTSPATSRLGAVPISVMVAPSMDSPKSVMASAADRTLPMAAMSGVPAPSTTVVLSSRLALSHCAFTAAASSDFDRVLARLPVSVMVLPSRASANGAEVSSGCADVGTAEAAMELGARCSSEVPNTTQPTAATTATTTASTATLPRVPRRRTLPDGSMTSAVSGIAKTLPETRSSLEPGSCGDGALPP